jgi:hypothetical protein
MARLGTAQVLTRVASVGLRHRDVAPGTWIEDFPSETQDPGSASSRLSAIVQSAQFSTNRSLLTVARLSRARTPENTG